MVASSRLYVWRKLMHASASLRYPNEYQEKRVNSKIWSLYICCKLQKAKGGSATMSKHSACITKAASVVATSK